MWEQRWAGKLAVPKDQTEADQTGYSLVGETVCWMGQQKDKRSADCSAGDWESLRAAMKTSWSDRWLAGRWEVPWESQ